MILNTSLIIQFLVALTIEVVTGENQRCFVCIPNIGSSIADVVQIFPSGPSLPLCNRFQRDKKEFVRECPSSKYVGCLTQTNGTHVTKTCSSIGVEDCKTANKIEYCYCKGDLCNGGTVPAEEARPPVAPGSGSGDDDEDTESFSEGSGSSEDASVSSGERKGHSTPDDIGIEIPGRTPATTPTTTVGRSSGSKLLQSFFLTFLLLAASVYCD